MNDNVYTHTHTHTYLMKCYSAMKRKFTIEEAWVDLEDIMLNEISHTEKAK